MNPRAVISCLLVGFALGCASTEEKINYYQVPAADTANATIAGSVLIKTQARKDERTFVSAIDGLALNYYERDIETPIAIKPGPHAIQMSMRHGRWYGKADAKADLKPGGEYVVRSKIEPNAVGAFQGSAQFWIEDKKTREPASEKVVANIESPEVDFRQDIFHNNPALDNRF
jgi:hypothetical protein